jgi:hypothetical protein
MIFNSYKLLSYQTFGNCKENSKENILRSHLHDAGWPGFAFYAINIQYHMPFACLPTKFAPLINCFRFILLYYRNFKGPDTPDAIRQRDAIFRFSLTDNFDPSLNSPNI